MGLRPSIAALALVACNSSQPDGLPLNNGQGAPSCATTDPCYADGGFCFTCEMGSGVVCACPDAGPDASPYRSSCIGTEKPCTVTH